MSKKTSKKEKLPSSKAVAGTVELQTKKIRGGVAFGVGRCTVSIGPAGVEAVAVKVGKKRRVLPADDGRAAAVWLAANSGKAKLSLDEAQDLVLAGLEQFDARAAGGKPEPVAEPAAARSLVLRLSRALDYAINVFNDTCDCDNCGPCRKRKQFERLAKESAAFLSAGGKGQA